MDADQAVRLFVEVVLQGDDDELHLALLGPLADVRADARDIPLRCARSREGRGPARRGLQGAGRGESGVEAWARALSSAASISSITKKGEGW